MTCGSALEDWSRVRGLGVGSVTSVTIVRIMDRSQPEAWQIVYLLSYVYHHVDSNVIELPCYYK